MSKGKPPPPSALITREQLPSSRLNYPQLLSSLSRAPPSEAITIFRHLCQIDLYFLLRYGLDRPFVDHDWWFDRCREVQFAPNGYIDLWAREHGKSTIITIALTIQDILNDPEITVGIFSHTRPLAKSFLRVIKREFETNEKLKECFSDILWTDPQKEAPKWSEDDGIIVKRKGNPPESTVEACGLVDGMPTGRHFQLRVYDDVVTRESVNTPDQIQKTTDAMDLSSNLGKIGGVVRIIGTRYKLGDTYEEYIKRGKYKERRKPATDDGTENGRPVFLSQSDWDDKLLDMSSAIIASQMLQNPRSSDSVIFQEDWFNFWPHDKALPHFDAVFQMFDGAFSKKETADYSCLLTFGLFKAKEGDIRHSVFVLDCIMVRLSYSEMRDEVIKQYQSKFGERETLVSAIIIEDKSSGSAMIPDLRLAEISVIPYDPGGLDKVGRANLVSHLVRDGLVWLPESANPKKNGKPMSWLGPWFEQMTTFPNVVHDDGVDAATMGLSVLKKMGYIRGRSVPTREQSYWKRNMRTQVYG